MRQPHCLRRFATPVHILIIFASWRAHTHTHTHTCSQVHRELTSGLSMPVGFKNGTSGDCQIAADAIKAAKYPHSFLSVTSQGTVAIVNTKGNADCQYDDSTHLLSLSLSLSFLSVPFLPALSSWSCSSTNRSHPQPSTSRILIHTDKWRHSSELELTLSRCLASLLFIPLLLLASTSTDCLCGCYCSRRIVCILSGWFACPHMICVCACAPVRVRSLILRGGSKGTNYDATSVAEATAMLDKAKVICGERARERDTCTGTVH